MEFKKSMLILIAAIFLASVAGVCAGDVNDTAIASDDADQIKLSPNDEITGDSLKTSGNNVELTQANDNESAGEGTYPNSRDDAAPGEIPAESTPENDGLTYSGGQEAVGDEGNVVSEENFYDYFDDSGTLLDSVAYDELIFEGDFSDVGVNYMTIGKPIRLTGNEATFNGIAFVIDSDDVTVDGFAITQYSDIYSFYVVGRSNVTLSNNNIDYEALEGFDSYAVYAPCVRDFRFINNIVTFTGNTDGTVVNNALLVIGDEENGIISENILIEGNVFDIAIPSASKNPVALSEGIAFYYCKDVEFSNNDVTLRYNDVLGSEDEIYVISVKGNPDTFNSANPIACNDVTIFNNTITAEGHSCIYGIFADAENLNISENRLDISADAPSNSSLPYNSIAISAKGTVLVKGNDVNSTGIAIFAFESNLTVKCNSVNVAGDYPIVLEGSNATITDNYLIGKKGRGNLAAIGDRVIHASGNTPLLKVRLIATDLTKVYGDAQQFTVQLMDENQEAVANKTIALSVGGANMTNVTDENGFAVFDINWDNGNYPVVSSFAGDDAYAANSTENTIRVNKANSTLSLDDVSMDYGASINVTATAGGATGITAKIDGNNAAVVNNFTIPISGLAAGNYNLTVTTIPDGNYIPITKTVSITVRKAASTLTLGDIVFDYKASGSGEVSFTNATGIAAGIIGHPEAIVTLENNTITLSNLGAGTYTLTATTITDANHNNVTRNATITVNRLKTQLAASAVTTTYNVNKDLVITLKDSKGNPLSGLKLSVNINSANTYVTDKNGQVKIAAGSLTPKTYTAKIAFNGDSNYIKSSKDVKVTVKKANPKMTAKAKTFKKSLKTKKYTITLKSNANKAIAKVKVTLKVKGKTYTASTNAKGVATFNLKKLTKKGTFKATVKFAGNAYYNAVTKTVKIKIR